MRLADPASDETKTRTEGLLFEPLHGKQEHCRHTMIKVQISAQHMSRDVSQTLVLTNDPNFKY